jgi:6-phosphogluconolactonase (cycloisomerase 2 family)
MGMKFSFLRHLLLPALLVAMTACSNGNNSRATTGSGLLYVAAQSNTSISAYTVNLSSGGLSTIGAGVGTGSVPSAIAIAPSVNALFVANSGSNSISSYTINSDGSLTAGSATTPTGTTPTALALDAAGKFLFVANQGSSSISVFTINGSTLAKVAGSPFTTIPAGFSYPNGTLPSGVVVSNSGKFLYVANQLANFVSAFSISASGALAPLGVPFYNAGTGPAGLAITPNGGFLYVANSGADSNNISAFAICDAVVNSCANPNTPDGTLTQVLGSPFSAGLGPVAIAMDPNFNFLYVVDKGSNTVSQYAYGTGSGVLAPLSSGTVSTGLNPVSIAIRPGATGTNLGNTLTNPTDYVFVANIGAGTNTISTFTLNTTSGQLTVLGTTVTTFAQTSAVAVK